ncbi:MAG: uracil-DNA glycosylase [Candidatus Eisenbacteria bacterium]
MKRLEEFAGIVFAAKSYFQSRLSMGETSMVLAAKPALGRASGSAGSDGAARRGAFTAPTGATAAPTEALARIEENVRACKKCPLHKTRTHTVFGTGSGRTRLVFIGEAPGRDEDLKGEPFVGRAGQLLTRIIEAIDLDRGEVYITNVIKCRPEGNRDPLPEEIELCSDYLTEQLEVLRPKVICALGRFAAQALSGLKLSMADYRTRELSYRGTRVIATYHPAACLRNAALKRPVWEDMQTVRDILKHTETPS